MPERAQRNRVLFHIRHGVRWHDGTPFTGKDVVATVHKILDPSVRARHLRNNFADRPHRMRARILQHRDCGAQPAGLAVTGPGAIRHTDQAENAIFTLR
jgi:ABC-type transport system substrate-binding protein